VSSSHQNNSHPTGKIEKNRSIIKSYLVNLSGSGSQLSGSYYWAWPGYFKYPWSHTRRGKHTS